MQKNWTFYFNISQRFRTKNQLSPTPPMDSDEKRFFVRGNAFIWKLLLLLFCSFPNVNKRRICRIYCFTSAICGKSMDDSYIKQKSKFNDSFPCCPHKSLCTKESLSSTILQWNDLNAESWAHWKQKHQILWTFLHFLRMWCLVTNIPCVEFQW